MTGKQSRLYAWKNWILKNAISIRKNYVSNVLELNVKPLSVLVIGRV